MHLKRIEKQDNRATTPRKKAVMTGHSTPRHSAARRASPTILTELFPRKPQQRAQKARDYIAAMHGKEVIITHRNAIPLASLFVVAARDLNI